MRFTRLIQVMGLGASPMLAQRPAVMTPLAPPTASFSFGMSPRATIGLSTVSGASNRDTLGVLISMIRSGSPAEKSGLEEGDRIASVNGVNLRLARADVGDDEMASAMNSRLARAISHLKPGDNVELRVYSSGAWKNVSVKAEEPEDARRAASMRESAPRASLGVSIASTGNARDSLGILITSVSDSGPAAKAGLEEGNRIQSINGVDLRTPHSADDDGDIDFGSPSMRKLQSEMARLKPGDVAKLRVYADGAVRSVDVKTTEARDFMQFGNVTILRPSIDGRIRTMRVAPPPEVRFEPDMAGMVVRSNLDSNVARRLRRTLDEMRVTAAPMLERLGTSVQNLGFNLERRRLDW